MKVAGGALRTMLVPQLEMQPLVAACAVPGAPVLVLVQNSAVVPHWPQTSQQAFSRQGFSVERSVPAGGLAVPGTCGPQTALATVAGMGGVPVLRHMLTPTQRLLQPFQPQVYLLKFSRSVVARL